MFFKNIHVRIKYVMFIVFICFLLIILRVFYVQIFQYNKLKTLAESLWSRNLPITADRGIIFDRNGKELASNITTTSLVLIPNQIKEKEKEKVTKDLSNILGVEYEEMFKHVSKKTSIERVHPEGRQLSYDVADKIDALGYDGVYLVKESKRYYPYDNLLSHTLGYVGIDNQGLSGLELYYDDYLTGENGAIKYFSDGKGNKLELSEVYEQPQNGINITLTIDLDIQLAIENELNNLVSQYNPDNALVIAMDPNNGEILGMASRPDFDSNNYKNYSTEVINRNLPIWMTYEPGSTFKIITLASSIEEKAVNIFEDNFYDSGSVKVGGATIHCWKHGGHGLQTYLQVVENSCNPGFVNLGLKLGKNTLFGYINKFGFGEKTGIDLNGESNGILFSLDKVNDLELATTAFGQGISVTPIQQVSAVSAAINGGYLYTPYIVSSFSEPETNTVIKKNEKILKRQVISEETSKLVRFALENVVAHGSGKNAYVENYRVGGKTGTAQKVNNGAYMVGNYILSFIGFMPADDPKVILYVAVDNPKGIVQYGGTVAAPIARNIFESIISIWGLKQTSNGIPKNYNWLDTKYISLPNVEGMDLNEAKNLLGGFKIEYVGEGNTIIEQSPEGDTLVKENSTIRLMLK